MTNHFKVDDEYVPVIRPYIKVAGIWMPAKETLVKAAGVYESSWEYDKIPPAAPEITYELTNKKYLTIGARVAGVSHDTTLKRIRVLVKKGTTAIATYNSSGFITTADKQYPNEPWSDWFYNGHDDSDHGNSNILDYKEYPPNPTSTTRLEYGATYQIAAWAQDDEDNWSEGTFTSFKMPRSGGDFTLPIQKKATFRPIYAGSLDSDGNFVAGDPTASQFPVRDAIFYFGEAIANAVGSQKSPVTITKATWRVQRQVDSGEPEATVELAWLNKNYGDEVVVGDFNGETVMSSTVSKGQAVNFNLPTGWKTEYNTNLRAIAIMHGSGTGNYMVAEHFNNVARSGELYLEWKEGS